MLLHILLFYIPLVTGDQNGGKSLFDDLPLNGALVESESQIKDSSLFSPKSETRTKGGSLFDSLPNQGALPSSFSHYGHSSSEREEIGAKKRSSRESLLSSVLTAEASNFVAYPPESEVRILFSDTENKHDLDNSNSGGNSNTIIPIISPARNQVFNRQNSGKLFIYNTKLLCYKFFRLPKIKTFFSGSPLRFKAQQVQYFTNQNSRHRPQKPSTQYGAPSIIRNIPNHAYQTKSRSRTPNTQYGVPLPVIKTLSRNYGPPQEGSNFKSSSHSPRRPPATPPDTLISIETHSHSFSDTSEATYEDQGDEFKTHRTLFTIGDHPDSSGGWGPSPPPTNSPVSKGWGPPPSRHHHHPPIPPPSYGPPPPPPQKDVAPPAPPPNDRYETKITLQTIPVTRQVTEFVQVPNIVHTIATGSSGIQSDAIQMPAPPPRHQNKGWGRPNGFFRSPPSPPPPQRKASMTTERPFESHLKKILFSAGDSTNTRDELLTELLLNQGAGGDDFDLESLLVNNRQISPPRISLGGRFRNLFRGPNDIGGRNNILGGNLLGGLRNLGGRDDTTIQNLVREIRLQNALSNLRTQIRQQGNSARRDRDNLKSTFYKSALALSALSLLPRLAAPATAMATSSAISAPAFMMPILSGRRRKKRNTWEMSSFDQCLKTNMNSTVNWIDCAKNLNQTDNHSGFVLKTLLNEIGELLPTKFSTEKNIKCLQKFACDGLTQVSRRNKLVSDL